jgi:hypothetical protein
METRLGGCELEKGFEMEKEKPKWKIIKITYSLNNTGNTWIPKLLELYPFAIQDTSQDEEGNPSQKVDLIVIVQNTEGDTESVGIELKHKDDHHGLVGEGNTTLIHELQQSYFEQFDHIWVFYTENGMYSPADVKLIESVCFEKCCVQQFMNQEKAILGIAAKVKKMKKDYIHYRNEAGADSTLERMLRQFRGINDSLVEKISQSLAGMPVIAAFNEVQKYLSGDVLRLWKDWYYHGIDPIGNTIDAALKRFFEVPINNNQQFTIKDLIQKTTLNPSAIPRGLAILFKKNFIMKKKITPDHGRSYLVVWKA